MRRAASILLVLAVAGVPCEARQTPRSYLAFAGGVSVLTGSVMSDVVDRRSAGQIELGVGVQLSRPLLLEFTYGWQGTYEQEPPVFPILPGESAVDTDRAFKVGINSLLFRFHYARSGVRAEYLKPEFSLGLGWMQVTRLLRNYPTFQPEETSQLLATVELGASALVVFSKNFSGTVGARYVLTERRGVVDSIDRLDGVVFLIGFRTFLPSPRDAVEPEP